MRSWICFSGIHIEQAGHFIHITDMDGNTIPDDTILSVGINDYIPAVMDAYFPAGRDVQDYTTAEALIYYLDNMSDVVSYPDCNRYFRYK